MDKLAGLQKCLGDIICEINMYNDYISQRLDLKTKELSDLLNSFGYDVKKIVCKKLLELVNEENIYTSVWLYSFAVSITEDEDILSDFLNYVVSNNKFKKNNLYYLYHQIKSVMFLKRNVNTYKNTHLLWKLLKKVLEKFKEEAGLEFKALRKDECDDSLAVIITQQYLMVQHGPTKTALDRAVVLMRNMGKRVILINTAEMLSGVGSIPFWRARSSNYIEEFKNDEYKEWNGCKIPYMQCDNYMPELNAVKYLVKTICDLKPKIVVSIGAGSVVAGLVNEVIPVLALATTTSGVMPSLSDYQIVPEVVNDYEVDMVRDMGKKNDFLIRGKFTFSLVEQTENVTREELGLPKDKFLLCVVGGRLNYEISAGFVRMLEPILGDNVGLVVIGNFDKLNEFAKKYPNINNNIYNLGHCDDVLSRLELCDLYINPERRGGGTSCVEAMYKGLPVVTTAYGDVAGIVGENFICKDYDEMAEIIMRYANDSQFYSSQVEIAKEIAEICLDSATEFKRCIDIYLESRD